MKTLGGQKLKKNSEKKQNFELFFFWKDVDVLAYNFTFSVQHIHLQEMNNWCGFPQENLPKITQIRWILCLCLGNSIEILFSRASSESSWSLASCMQRIIRFATIKKLLVILIGICKFRNILGTCRESFRRNFNIFTSTIP